MWRFSRPSFVFSRWPRNQQNHAEISKPSLLPAVGSFPSDGKKRSSNNDQKKKKQFKENDPFWNCNDFQFFQLKSSILEKAGCLSTVAILFFNFHNIHSKCIQDHQDHEFRKSYCLLPRNVYTVPQDSCPTKNTKKNELPTDFEDAFSKTFPSSIKLKQQEASEEEKALSELKNLTHQYAAAVHNLSGLSNLEANKRKAFKQFYKAANEGSSQGYYNLGLCYELGNGTQKNLIRASYCYKKAAMNGHGLASYNLAVLFTKGVAGLPVDFVIAKQLMDQAAEKNVPEAQLYMGLDYLENKKYTEAFEMFKTLSDNNMLEGKYRLGICYEKGWGVNKDEVMAADLFFQAAKSGHSESVLKLSKFYEEGVGGCDKDINLAMALFQIVSGQKDETKKLALLQLKKATLDKETSKEILPFQDSLRPMRNSSSVPEFKSYQNKKHSTEIMSFSCLDLKSLLFPGMTGTNSPKKNMFYIGNNELPSKLTIPSSSIHQFNVSRLMVTKS